MAFDEDLIHDEKNAAPYYVAPEMFVGNYNEKCDIWSIGVIAYVSISGITPFDGDSHADIMKNVQTGKYTMDNAIWQNVTDEAKDFIKQCLTKKVDKRPTAE